MDAEGDVAMAITPKDVDMEVVDSRDEVEVAGISGSPKPMGPKKGGSRHPINLFTDRIVI